jgi:hypothetical protein
MEQTAPMDFTESVQSALNILHHKCYLWEAHTCSAVWGNSHAQGFFGDIFGGLSWKKYVTDIVSAGGEHAEAMAVYMDAMIHSQARQRSLVLSTRAKWLLPAYVEKLGVSADETLQLFANPVVWLDRLHLLVHYKPMPDHDLHLLAGETGREALNRVLDLAGDTGRWVREDISTLKRLIASGGNLSAPLSTPLALRVVDEEVRRFLLLTMTGSTEIVQSRPECRLVKGPPLAAHPKSLAAAVAAEGNDELAKWEAEHSSTDTYPLTVVGMTWFRKHELLDDLQIDAGRLRRYLEAIERQYREVPYHNVWHVHSVLRLTGALLQQPEVLTVLACEKAGSAPLHRFSMYMAAFVHDVGHDGLTNAYLCANLERPALVHNDCLPNENTHVSTAFLTMFEEGHDFFHAASRETFRVFRSTVIRLVTLTDMQKHKEVVSRFQDNRRAGMMDCATCLPFLLVCADLGHTVLPWERHHEWVLRLQEEMFLQGDRERHGELGVSPLCDRTREGITRSQVPFFEVVVIPLYAELAAMCPTTVGLLNNARSNRQRWADM